MPYNFGFSAQRADGRDGSDNLEILRRAKFQSSQITATTLSCFMGRMPFLLLK